MSGLRIKDQLESDRPREKLAALGPEALGHAELIAILLRTGLKGMNAIQVGTALLQTYEGSLQALARAKVDDLIKIAGIGRDKAVTLMAAFALAKRMSAELHGERPLLDKPELIADFLREEARSYETERFVVLLLNTRRRLISIERVAIGTLDSVHIHPREVFRPAISANASGVVLLHNHPSGDPTPSESDIKITRDLIRAGQLLRIELLDHIVLGRKTAERLKDYSSLRELGYFYT